MLDIKIGPVAREAVVSVVRSAENMLGPNPSPQNVIDAVVIATTAHLTDELAVQIHTEVDAASEMAEVMDEDRGEAIRAALAGVIDRVGENAYLASSGDAVVLAGHVLASVQPSSTSQREWLEGMGVRTADYAVLLPEAKLGAPVAPPSGPAAPPQPPAPPSAPPAAAKRAGAPPVADLARALQQMGDATTVDYAALATEMDVSRSTISNYLSGKTAKPKVDARQAAVLARECRRRAELLTAAADALEAL